MSLETDALDAAAAAATAQTIAANSLKDAMDTLNTGYAATKATVDDDLNNVENTADADKPVSTAAATALGLKQDNLVDGTNLSTVNGVSLQGGDPLVIARGPVEVPKLVYASRASLRTPVVPLPASGDVVVITLLGHFQYSTVFEFLDDDETVFEAVDPADGITPIGQWVMTHPSYEWTEAQKMFENALLWEWMEDEALRVNT
tara:strand:+ start:692 stop:1300 length:609 start_codon:yes stop_codon:yes gene_type:complete